MKIELKKIFILGKKGKANTVLLALIMISSVFVSIVGNVGAVDIYEPDNTYLVATLIPTDGSSQSHDLDPIGDEDWVTFVVVPGTTYTIETLNLSSSCDTYIQLYESDGISLIDSDNNGGVDLGSRIIWDSTGYTAGNYYVRVTEYGGNGGPTYTYDIRIFEGTYAEFLPPHSDYGLDTDGDSLFNYLVVNVTVNVGIPGDYRIYGYLYDSLWNWIEGVNNYTYLTTGIQIVELYFEGFKIYNNGDNGSYNVDLYLEDDNWNSLDWDSHATNPYTYDQFQLPPISFTGNFNDYGLDTDGDTLYNFLVIEAELEVLVSGNYYVEIDLHQNATMNHIDQNRTPLTFLPGGIQTVTVYFNGAYFYQSGLEGPYILNSVWLYDEFWDLIQFLDDPYITAYYNWTEFQPPPAVFEPPHSDYGLDTDGDGLFNYLVVNVTVNVSVAGDYRIYGWLYDTSWNWMDDDNNYTFLPVGFQIVELRFDGYRIYNNGDSGYYNATLEIDDNGGNWLDSDTHPTNLYSYDEFQPPPATFEPPHSDYGLDTDGDGLFNYLVVNATVNVTVAGDYRVYGYLYDSSWNWIEGTNNYTYLSVGVQTVELWYDGLRIYTNGDNGSYNLNLDLRDGLGNWLESDTHITNFYYYDQFQPPPAEFLPPHSDYGLDSDGDGLFDYLIVNVTVNVRTAGDYRIYGYLYDSSWNWIDDFYLYPYLSAGIQIVQLQFEGWMIYNSGDNGSYNVNLELRDDSGNWLDSDSHITNIYTYDQFKLPPAEFSPPHSDYGLDTDGDGLFNYLVVNATVNVNVAGNYEIRGRLRDSFMNTIETIYNNTYLSAGIQMVEFRFDGLRIYNNGDNCTYTVELRLRDSSGNTLDTDTHTTKFYTYDQFQPPPAEFFPPHSDYGLDTDGDGLFNYLVVNVTVNVRTAGDYEIRGRLRDSSWNSIETVYNYTYLATGLQVVKLEFEGWRIYTNEDNCSYTVELWLYDYFGYTLDTDSHTTKFYTYDEFQRPAAMFYPPHSDYGLDTDSDGLFNYLVVNVTVNVSAAGYYQLYGELYDSSWNWIDDVYNYLSLPVGIQTVQLQFEGLRIYNNGDNGSYYVELDIRDDFGNWLDSDTHITNFYYYDQFQPPAAEFFPPHSDYGLDTDGDGLFNYLVVNVTVDVRIADNYEIRGRLRDSSWNTIETVYNYTYLAIGLQVVKLEFEGWRIYTNGDNCSYTVELWLYDSFGYTLDTDSHITKFYIYDEFQRPPAMFKPPHSDYGLDTDSDGLFDYLAVNVTVNVSLAGSYEVRGRLRDSSLNIIQTVYNNSYLTSGIQIVELRFEGWRIYNNEDNCSYTVQLWLYDSFGYTLDTDSHTTNFYTYDEFQRPAAMFYPPHSDYGLDTDIDGLFNYLVVNVMVNVNVAGDYEIRAILYDSSWNWIQDFYNYTYLGIGIQTVEFRFDGWRIYTNGDNCSYNVDLDIWDSSWNLLDSDIYITSYYTYDEFQRPAALFYPPHSDYGLDTDGDGLFNYLVVNATVNVSVAGNYEIRGRLYDSSMSSIQTVYNNTYLAVGYQIVEIWFEGWRIYNNGDNCNYTVNLRLRDSSGNTLDTDSYLTSYYTYDEFQRPPAMFKPPHSDYGLDTNGDGLFNYLIINVTVNVSVAGDYEIRGILYDSFWNWIEDVYNYTALTVGIQVVEIRFEGWKIYTWGVDGSYYVELQLRDTSWNLLDLDTYTTKFYTYDQFQTPPASLTGNFNDYGLDTDGDSFFDFLVIEVEVNVSVAGNYYVEVDLHHAATMNHIYQNNSGLVFLPTGIQTVLVYFEGWYIRQSGYDGPYILYRVWLYDDSWNTLDYLNNAYITGPYNWTDFQPLALFEPPHSDYGLDTDGDTLFNYLVLEVMVKVSTAGDYYVVGILYDSSLNQVEDDFIFTYLNPGIQKVELRFDGWWIYMNGDNCTYTVELTLYDSSTNLLDSDTYTTNYYEWDEFQVPPPPISPPWLDDFEFGSLGGTLGLNWTASDPNYAGVGTHTSQSGIYSMYTRGGIVIVTSYIVDMSGLSSAEVSCWIRRGDSSFSEDPDLGEDLIIQYKNDVGNWVQIGYFNGDGTPGEIYSPTYSLPADALHSTFQLRFIQTGGSGIGNDYWHIDDVYVGPPVSGDVIPPADITDLAVVGTTGNSATLTWTAPGDDGWSGTASQYDIRYSDIGPITTDLEFDSADEVIGEPSPQPGGSPETFVVTGLDPGKQYWFAIKTADEVPNWSNVSNSPSGTTLDILVPLISNVMVDGQISVVVSAGTFVTLTATIDDLSTGNSDIAGANCTLGFQNWGSAVNMSAVNPPFDDPTEDVTLTIDTTGWAEGSHDLYVYGWDAVPNYNTVSTSFATIIIDSIPPSDIIDLNVVSTTANSVTLTWTASGDDGMSGTATSYEIKYSITGPIDDTNWSSATVFAQSWVPLPATSTETCVVTGLNASTQYWFAIKVGDEVPNWSNVSNSPTGTTLADDLAPQISNVKVNGQSSIAVTPGTIVTLTATISDSGTGNSNIGGANCTFGAQDWGNSVNMNATNPPFDNPTEEVTLTIDTTSWPEGSYELYVYGWDVIPNYNTISTAYATIIIDQTPPTSSVDTISPYWQSSSLTITATASDTGGGIESVELFYRFSTNNSTWSPKTSFGIDTTSPWEWSFTFPNGDGYYRFYSIAKDTAGNTETAPEFDASCGYDTKLPTSTIEAISPYWLTISTITITATASDVGSGLATIELFYRHSIDNSTWSSWISFEVDSQSPWEWSFDFPSGDGYYEFYTMASDKAMNQEGAMVVEAICGYDVSLPIANAGPDQQVTEGSIVTFDGSGSSDNILLDTLTWTFMDVTIQTLYGVNPTYTFNTEGNYLITLTITDACGNSNSDTFWVNVSGIANTGSISGRVTDENGNPIKGATVTVVGTTFKATTNETGHYTITDVPAGTYDISIKKGGYEGDTMSDVTVTAGEDTQTPDCAIKKAAEKGITDYWWAFLILAIVVVLVGVLLFAKSKKKKPEAFEDLEALEPERPPPTSPEPTDHKEPYKPISPKPEQTPPPDEMPPPPPPI